MVEKRLFGDFTQFARAMFHGRARRYGADYPLLEYRLGAALQYPLSVTKNIYGMAQICQPNLTWVVSELVQERLRAVPAVDFLQVQFEKVFQAPYKPEDDPFPDAEDDDAFFDRFENDRGLARELGSWYEVIVPNLDTDAGVQGGIELSISRELSALPLRLTISDAYVAEHPIFWFDEFFIRSDVFAMIESQLDKRYFAVSRVR